MTRATPSLSLTREAILGDGLRALVQAADPEARCISAEEHKASIGAVLAERAAGGDVWLFAYGSLIWNPLIHFVEREVGTVHGYHRCFCLWSHTGRGTKAKPGLMLGLERGGACRGIAYRIAERLAAEELNVVWRREMLTGAYAPRWVPVVTKAGPVQAIAFLINRRHARYAGKLPENRIIASIAEAHGPLGACATYLFNTVAHLEELGIRDRRLERLRDRVTARLDESGRTPQ
jgi:glutathione-specific gamma-glutamylcyclotransferase